MAKTVVARNQQLEMARAHPKPSYSRVVMVSFDVVGGAGNKGFAFTDKFGQKLWLLNVQFWFRSKTVGTPCFVSWRVVTCVDEPKSYDQIILELEPVMQMRYYNLPYMGWRSEAEHFSFDMMKFYEGQPRRFAIGVMNGSAPGLIVMASFEISEG